VPQPPSASVFSINKLNRTLIETTGLDPILVGRAQFFNET
jgi:hypothetical protein